MPTVQLSDASLHYEIAGDGPPILLIAGLASDSASWGPLPPLLPRHRLIMPDNRGSGRTRSDGPIAWVSLVDDLVAVLDHLGIGQTDVVGHSMGGYLGLALSARHPNRVRRLVTMASGVMSPARGIMLRDMAKLYRLVAPELWFRLLYQWLFSDAFFTDPANVDAAAAASTAYPYRQLPDDFARQLAAIGTSTPVDMAAIRCPVLAIAAEHDLLASADAVRLLHQGTPDLRTAVIAGAAHSLHWEAPSAVAAAINGFLEP